MSIDRFSSQIKKKLKHGSTLDIVDSVKTELGWVGLCILFFCLISVCYVIIIVMYGGSNNNGRESLHSMHNSRHPDHMRNQHDINSHLNADGSAMEHGLNIDPEHWPHHLSSSEERENNQNDPRVMYIYIYI